MKTELHCHTREGSLCGWLSAKDTVKAHKEAGYDAIVITNHYNKDNLNVFCGNIHEKVNKWMDGYRMALEAGEETGLKVFFGMEVRNFESDNDFLVYGVTPEKILSCEDLCRMPLKELRKEILSMDGIMIQAHPNRKSCYPVSVEFLDGLEVFNACRRHENQNQKTRELAGEHPHLIQIAGSDFHRIEDLGGAYVVFQENVKTEHELKEMLYERKFVQIV